MRRITLWALSTFSAVVILFSYHTSTAGAGAGVVAVSPATAGTGSSGSSAAGSSDSAGSAGSSDTGSSDTGSSDSSGSSASASGTYTGDAVQTRWGPVQVRITVSAGRITAVDAVVYPDGNQRDVEINAYAIPTLNAEAVQAQGADIDMVSGASVTSEGYVGSLQSALDQAGL